MHSVKKHGIDKLFNILLFNIYTIDFLHDIHKFYFGSGLL